MMSKTFFWKKNYYHDNSTYLPWFDTIYTFHWPLQHHSMSTTWSYHSLVYHKYHELLDCVWDCYTFTAFVRKRHLTMDTKSMSKASWSTWKQKTFSAMFEFIPSGNIWCKSYPLCVKDYKLPKKTYERLWKLHHIGTPVNCGYQKPL